MNRPENAPLTLKRNVFPELFFAFIALNLAALACNTLTGNPGGHAGDSQGSGEGSSGIGGPTRPVGFVNHGRFDAVVMPWTFLPQGSDRPEIPPDVSTVSTAPGSPGLWPNSSRFLSLPFGTYTWCFAWDEGDLNGDGYVDYFHFFDERPVTVDENASDDPDLALQVDFSAPPEGGEEILPGPCGDQPADDGEPGEPTPRLLPGNAQSFRTPPPLIAFANAEAEPPPAGVTVSDTCGGACWRHFGWLALLQPGQSLEAAASDPVTAVGVQFWGDLNDGWARVLVDGKEVWTGNTYGSDDDPFIRYLQIGGLPRSPHTVRVEHMGQNDVTVYFFGFGLASP
jgi:hypothetical protein